ncbi:hypothetical protein [Streptomyces griseoruber]|uniref:Uncharacterized protein n=1 Tax=Streptomyces griseoruber TaxID=1943 RepID=A0A101T4E6_9ACTN|nr:hypothetical protein [Streptomyces griseoruber]KUN85625.1 hypothetical protein AQJ64_10885 [Streptomyces griseoruber]
MAGKRGRGDAAEDVEAVLDGLYTTPPSGFVARREELAVAARTAGRAEDARRIHGARRPTLAAWAANLLLRSQPEESHRFLELGQALRRAHRDLDPAGVRELSAQRRMLVAALTRQTADLALDAGQRLSAAVLTEVTATLQAVLADPAAADRWAGGRLDSALVPPSGFPPGLPSGPARESAVRSGPAHPPRTDELARVRRERLTRAREAADAAARRLDDRRVEHTDAEAAVQRARDHHGRARQEVEDTEEALRRAREALRTAAGEEQRAQERYRTTADALARAEREARRAAREAERLEPSPEDDRE